MLDVSLVRSGAAIQFLPLPSYCPHRHILLLLLHRSERPSPSHPCHRLPVPTVKKNKNPHCLCSASLNARDSNPPPSHFDCGSRSNITRLVVQLLFTLRLPPTASVCQQLRSCVECVSARIGFHCFWCHGVGRCSHGLLDRYRQEWVHAGCPEKTHGDICGEDPERNLTSTAPGTRGGATTAPSGVSLGEERRRELEEATPSAEPPQGGPRAGGLATVLGTLAALLLLLVVGTAAANRWARRPPCRDERLTGCLGRLRPTPRQPPYDEVCEML
ncbi:uncharacterized protein LOC116937789 [Petromyzon marinus]|uniref:uncharacterized protein LOC116937789 n=1 Tax=Petromyzon marinus TaxID=7757 RepID=UPI003F725F7C